MSMLLLATLLSAPQAAPAPDSQTEAAIRGLLDANGDDHLDRYEAAAAAMAWADAHPGVAAPPTDPGLDARAQAELEAAFAADDKNGNGALEQVELDVSSFHIPGWRLFDVSTDRRLDLEEAVTMAAVGRHSARFRVEGQSAMVRGQLDDSTPGRLLQVLLEHREVNELVLEFVLVQGEKTEALDQLGALIGQSGVTVRVPRQGTVMGAAVKVLAAGSRRIIERGSSIQKAPEGSFPAAPEWLTDEEIHDLGLRTDTEGLVLLQTGTQSSFRGLAAVSSEIAWATGSGATVVKTTDAGRSWSNVAPASIAGLDVRDVFAISADVAWIMTAGPGNSSRILFTEDGGATWTEQHRETAPEAFLDGLDAWDGNHLIAYGDPMEDGRFRVLLSDDGGGTWTPSKTGPLALETGEASFAASGTGLRTLDGLRAWIVTGGTKSTARVFWSEDSGRTWTPAATPVAAKGAGAGAFSVSFREDGTGVIVGGDFLDREAGGIGNAAYSLDFGKTWKSPEVGPRGQRAGSAVLGNGWFLATGQTGTDVSRDGGKTWRPFSSEGFHCVDAALLDGTIWFAGPKGRVARVR